MDPITIMAGATAVSGLVQYYNAEKARGAEKARLEEIEALYNAIKPPDYDLSIQAAPKLHEEMLKRPQFSDPMMAPQFNLDKLQPEELKVVGKLVPEVAPYIAEKSPELLTKTADMKTGREAQLNALRRFQEIGAGEFDPEYQQAVTMASRNAQADAQSRQNSLLQDFARRGQSGSGLSFAAQMGGNAQAMDREAMANMQAASDSYRNRLNALSQGAALGGQISNEDVNFQQRNADMINAFNQRLAGGRQQWENQRAGVLNNAQQYNLGVEQGLANQNVNARNNAALQNQQRLDALAKYGYDAQRQERDRQDQLAQWGYGQDVADRNYANQLTMSKASWEAGERDRINSLMRQKYQDQLGKAGIKAGISNQMSASDIGAAQDRNAAIQGLANAGMVYAQGSQARGDARAGQLARDDRSQYEKTGSWMSQDQLDSRKKRYEDDYY